VILVSIPKQWVVIYRNGVQIAASTCSTGRPGHRTPAGVFVILEKDKNHHSLTYDNAPMPYMERLTWGGVALHAGNLPAIRQAMAACGCRWNSPSCCLE
jgi:lipoprotein-anchoring transpeptidase ErfK/SrfK